MANEKFKVKFGLAVGDTAATVDGTTGDINTNGSITALQNLDIRGTSTLGNAPADTVTVNGDTLINNALTIGSSSGDTVTVNSQVTGNITFTDNSTTTSRGVTGTVGTNDYWKYGGGSTASDAGYAEIATGDNGTEPIYVRQYTAGSITNTSTLLDASGNTILGGDLFLENDSNLYVSGSSLVLNNNDTAGGNVELVSYRGTAGATSTRLLWNETTDRWTFTNDGTTFTNLPVATDSPSYAGATLGNISVGVATDNTIASIDTNGNLTLAPNGTGSVALTLADGGNLTNTRNYVKGVIRNSTLAAAGEIWAVNSTGPVSPFQGISVDNSADTTTGPATLLRSFSGGAVAGSATRGRLIFEKARGTSASPTAVQSGDFIGSIDATGYSSTGWINDTVPAVTAFFGFIASENWVSNTNLGTAFSLSQAPQATTVTSAANLATTLQIQPENGVMRSNRLAFSQATNAQFTATGCSTSGTTLTIGTLTAGTVAVGQVLQLTGPLGGHYIIANISGSGSGSTWQLGGSPGTLSGLTVTGNIGYWGSVPATSNTLDALQDFRLITNVIKSNTGATNITTSATNTAFSLPVKFPVYTAAAANAITGAVGWQISISDSPTSGGRMAFWDTTNTRWSYISDNSAV